MPWVRLETGIAQNPKILELLDAKAHRAALGYVFALAYAGAQETDGFIPRGALVFLHLTRKDAEQLEHVGLFDAVPGGWLIHDYLQYQPGREYRDQHRRAVCARWIKQGRPCSCGTHTQLRAVDTP